MKENLILNVDSYKASHWLQYPPGTEGMFSYLESRGGLYDNTVFFGLQYLLKEYLSTPVTKEDVLEAHKFFQAHGVPFNYDGWMYIVEQHGGRIPMIIRAVPEGTVVPTKNVLMTVESTDPKCFWVVSWFETLLMRLWYPITVATQSREVKKVIKQYLDVTSDTPEADLPFKLHDFGSRGVSSRESAAIGGAAHLVNFMGSDTVDGIVFANRYYGAEMAGFSIPAAEHSSVTSWGRDNEEDAYRNMLTQFGRPGSILAVVSDSYNIYNACTNLWGARLKEEVIKSGATVVIRPDSGDPVEVVMQLLSILGSRFGTQTNKKGFKVLNHVRIIQGDGCSPEMIGTLLQRMYLDAWSATNVAFGMGGALLQKVNRDTQKFAFKCSSINVREEVIINEEVETRLVERDVFKDPITDPGKQSKSGRLDLVKEGAEFRSVRLLNGEVDFFNSAMEVVYRNGVTYSPSTFDQVRERAKV